ncbi:hypothetical protein [Streptomyces sp. DHE17-7]|uniref:hypothetical protein n=1 Tax=Streptomyces sp. DHE17-7 TaxID=2759949 RepID=UPI0022EB5C33|nr:hypothetical protein [Streptomyces sp. DHE17-7]
MELVKAKETGTHAGSGITLQGNALRVLRELGVWEQVEASGFGFGSVGITAPDGTVLHVQDDLRTGGDDLPATVGMPAPRGYQRITQSRPCGQWRWSGLGTTDLDQEGRCLRTPQRRHEGALATVAAEKGSDAAGSSITSPNRPAWPFATRRRARRRDRTKKPPTVAVLAREKI